MIKDVSYQAIVIRKIGYCWFPLNAQMAKVVQEITRLDKIFTGGTNSHGVLLAKYQADLQKFNNESKRCSKAQRLTEYDPAKKESGIIRFLFCYCC